MDILLRRFLLALIFAPLASAQEEDLARFAELRAHFEEVREGRDVEQVYEGGQVLDRFAELADASREVREKACRFLGKIVEHPGGVAEIMRWRAAAVRVLPRLATGPEWITFLLDAGARSESRAIRRLEFFIERSLGQVATPPLLRPLLSALKSDNKAELRMALGGLYRLQNDELLLLVETRLDLLRRHAVRSNREIAYRAVRVLGRLDDPRVKAPLFEAAASDHELMRLGAAQAFRRHASLPGAMELLAKLLIDERPLIREHAAIALRSAPRQEAVPLLLRRIEKEPFRLRIEIAKSLRDLTGFDLGPEPGPWKDWARSNEASGRDPGDVVNDPEAARRGYARGRYYDIPVLSDRMVFILDVSGSMELSIGKSSTEPNRMEMAKKELVQVLEKLDPRSYFNIVLFEQKIHPWKETGLLQATPRRIKEATHWVRNLQRARGGTNSLGVLEYCFKRFEDADTIFFLSDGSPTVGRHLVHESIVREVAGWNRLRGIRLHTIAMVAGEPLNPFLRHRHDKDDAARFMKLLAEENFGRYRRVD